MCQKREPLAFLIANVTSNDHTFSFTFVCLHTPPFQWRCQGTTDRAAVVRVFLDMQEDRQTDRQTDIHTR